MTISHKMQQLSERSSWIRKMFEKGAVMKALYGAENVCDFSLGNPDIPPPAKFDQAIREAVLDTRLGVHDYAPERGHIWAREAIAKRISDEQKIAINKDDVVMTWGAAGGLNITLKAILNPGDEVIVLAPYFVDYLNYIDNHGGCGKVVNTDNEFDIDLDSVKNALSVRTKAIIINSPNNPTGQIYSENSLIALGDLLAGAVKRHNQIVYLIADEPYRKIVYDDYQVPSILRSYRNSMVISSYSKDLSLAGERIGYMAVHPDIDDKSALLDALALANNILGFRNPPVIMQRIIAELEDSSVDVSIYAKRKELICSMLSDVGFNFIAPKGTFYVFPQTPIADDVKFVDLLLEEKILTVPGVGFGTPGHIRIAFCVPEEVIIKSAEGFRRAFTKIS